MRVTRSPSRSLTVPVARALGAHPPSPDARASSRSVQATEGIEEDKPLLKLFREAEGIGPWSLGKASRGLAFNHALRGSVPRPSRSRKESAPRTLPEDFPGPSGR